MVAASGDVQAYQIRTAPTSTITPGVVMATSPALGTAGGTEEVTRKREVRLMKNRYVCYEVDENLHYVGSVIMMLFAAAFKKIYIRCSTSTNLITGCYS